MNCFGFLYLGTIILIRKLTTSIALLVEYLLYTNI